MERKCQKWQNTLSVDEFAPHLQQHKVDVQCLDVSSIERALYFTWSKESKNNNEKKKSDLYGRIYQYQARRGSGRRAIARLHLLVVERPGADDATASRCVVSTALGFLLSQLLFSFRLSFMHSEAHLTDREFAPQETKTFVRTFRTCNKNQQHSLFQYPPSIFSSLFLFILLPFLQLLFLRLSSIIAFFSCGGQLERRHNRYDMPAWLPAFSSSSSYLALYSLSHIYIYLSIFFNIFYPFSNLRVSQYASPSSPLERESRRRKSKRKRNHE